MPSQVTKKTCCQFCPALCGVLVHTEDGKVVNIEGNKDHLISHGFTCERPGIAPKWLYHPDQLMYPLKRVGKRGEGKWQRISWDDAMGEIGQKLIELKKDFGPETLGFFEGTYRGNDYWPRGRFATLFENPHNIFAPGIICGINDMGINMAVTGDVTTWSTEVSGSGCVVLWGGNPAQSELRLWTHLVKAKKEKDIKIIAVDPRQTRTTQLADIWLQLRPGTDTALAMGWLNVIINEELYDKDFVENWTTGFDKLRERVQEYPPEKVSEITGVPSDKIVEAARIYATNGPAAMPYGVAIDQLGLNGTRTEHAKVIMRAICGYLGTFGGHLITRPGTTIGGGKFITESELSMMERLSMETRRKMMGYDVCRLVSLKGWSMMSEYIEKVYGVPAPVTVQIQAHTTMLWRAILEGKPYPIKALVCWGSNPMAWGGNTRLIYEALKSDNLELHVVQELFMTPTAQLADYVFPATSWMERDLCTNMMDFASLLWAGEKAIEPMGERRDIYEFFRALALSVGQDDFWPWETTAEVSDYRLQQCGLTFRDAVERMVVFPDSFDLKPYEQTGFPTPSGKVELFSSILERLDYDPMPYYEEPPESPLRLPEVAKEYPLILNTGGNFRPMFHSEFMQWGVGSREKHPDPLMDIHPDTARDLGINDGDWAYIETRRGKIKQKARFNSGMLPNVVNCQASWWFPEKPAKEPELSGVWESNANVLTLDDPEFCDELSGGWCNRALLCKVYKAG
ncbi:MAG: molybdopterin-dependent oxidoreductase [Dehalococcoidia bacterium]